MEVPAAARSVSILILEDNPDDFLLIKRHLSTHGLSAACQRVETLAQLDAAFAQNEFDIILSDHSIPGQPFAKTLHYLQTHHPALPVILVSGQIGDEEAVDLFKDGVWDFVLKNNLSRLVPAIQRALNASDENRERELTMRLLRLLNATSTLPELVQNVTVLLRDAFGCDAVGIRLREGEDFPYFVTRGFPAEFVRLENSLCLRDDQGQIVRNPDGSPFHECMCGNILGQRFDPAKPYFTRRGSFWTASTSDLLANTTVADRQTRTRNRCNGEGYESVALVALRVGDTTHGLIQLNDKRKGKITAQSVALLERLADNFAVAIAHRQSNEKLRHSEELFRAMFDSASIGMAKAEPINGRFLRVNEKYCAITGYSVAELLHLRVRDITHPDDRKKDWETFQRVVRGELPSYHTEKRYVRKDGSIVWVNVNMSVIRDANGLPIRTIATIEDIQQRKQAEEALAAERNLLRTLTDHLPDLVFTKDLQGRITFVNAAMTRYQGAAPEEHLGKTVSYLNPPELAQRYRQDDERVLQKGELILNREELIRDHTGVDHFHLTTKAPLRDHTNAITGLIAICRNIDELKHTEIERARLTTAMEQAAEAIVITDTNACILYVNPAFEKNTGYTRAEAVGLNPRVLKSGQHEPAFYQEMWETLTSGQVWHGHFVNRRKDGTLYEEDATISPVRNAAGKIVNYIAIKLDVTRQIKLEAQFRQAQKLEAIGHLAGGVAHDFNNILAAILMNLGLLQLNPKVDEETRGVLKELHQEAQRGANLTRQLLLFSRRSVLAKQPLNLADTVENLLKMLRRLIGERIALRFESQPNLPPVEADPSMMEQVIVNLVVNARDAIDKGGQITLKTGETTLTPAHAAQNPSRRAGHFICLSVIDTGSGMDAATLKRIFEPFFTTKEKGKGTGLGLATVHGIVAQHKGWIEVDSTVGQGTAFHIYLPAGATTVPNAAQSQEPSAKRILCGQETILLVEDEPTLRKTLRLTLRKLGYQVHDVANATQALELWPKIQSHVHLLFTDMIMPGDKTGAELAAQLLAAKPNLKVILASGYSNDLVQTGLAAIKNITYLPKPFDADRLSVAVRACLDDKK